MTAGIVATGLLVWPAAPFFLFMHGKDITVPKGAEITAYINGDMKLDIAKFQPPPPTAAPVTAATEPQAAASTAELDVSSTPVGAEVEIDGNFVGNTPSTVGIAPGQHVIAVKKAGYKTWERKMIVSSGHIKVDASLEAQTN